VRKLLRFIGLSLLLALIAGPGRLVWSNAFPKVEALPLARHLVADGSPEGERLLATSSATADLAALRRAFTAQRYGSYCGAASAVTVLNAEGASLDQRTVFTPEARAARSGLETFFGGMSLPELGGILAAHGKEVHVRHAAESSLEDFRRESRENLARPGDYVIVNYLRPAVEQEGSGHLSPLAAYDGATDRFLVLDVAAHKYPPVWIEAARLFSAMDTVDRASGKSRGYLLVGR